MRIFVAGVSSELQYARGVNSFRSIQINKGDIAALHYGATGLTARKALCSEFLSKKEFDAIALMDLDMDFPVDTIQKLREHDLDMVTGHYYRRQYSPMVSIIDLITDDTWPHVPLLDVPKSGLHEIASTGMGCVIIKRHVIEAVAETLPPFEHPFDVGPLPWLTDSHIHLGQDKRFFALARRLGYKLWLDADVRCKHALTVWMDDDFYDLNRNRTSQAFIMSGLWLDNLGRHGVNKKTIKLRLQTLEMEREQLLNKFEAIREGKDLEELQPYILQLNEYDNRMAECTDWLTGIVATVKFPMVPEEQRKEFKKHRLGSPDIGIDDPKALHKLRQIVHQKEAAEFIEELDKRGRQTELDEAE
jgi:hypothetical protein